MIKYAYVAMLCNITVADSTGGIGLYFALMMLIVDQEAQDFASQCQGAG